jgi:DNA-binding beta-propeller fold protein YncE
MAKNPDDRFATAGDLGRAALAAVPRSDPGAGAETGAAATRSAPLDAATRPSGRADAGFSTTRELGKPQIPAEATARRRRRSLLAAAAAAMAAVALIAGLVLVSGGRDGGDGPASGAQATTAGKVIGSPVSVGDSPSAIVAGAGSVWVANSGDETVSRIDPRSGKLVGAPIAVGEDPGALAVGAGSVWVANVGDGTVTRIDPGSGRSVGAPIVVGRAPTDLVVGRGRVWVATELDRVVTIDARTGQVGGTPIRVNSGGSLTLAGDILWVADQTGGTLRAVDTATRAVRGDPIPIGDTPLDLAAGPDELWVSLAGEGAVKRVVLGNNGPVVRTIRTGGRPEFLALRQGALWVTNRDAESLIRLDIDSRELVGTPIRVGEDPAGIAIASDRVWVPSAVTDRVTIVDPR